MKTLLVSLVAVSLAGNAVLLAWRCFGGSVEGGGAVPVVAPSPLRPGSGESGADAESGVVQGQRIEPTLWGQLGASDGRTLVTNLREAGFPESDVQAVVRALMSERFTERRMKLLAANGPLPFWVSRRGDGLTAEQRAELRELRQSHEAEMRALLGAVPMTESERRSFRRVYGPLPDATIQAISTIQADYGELVGEIYREASGGMMMPWDREKIAFIEAEQRKDIEAALTPEERELHKWYVSGTATALRYQLQGFEPTEAEFRAIFAIRERLDPPSGRAAYIDNTALEQRRTLDAQAREEIRAVLGEARYADYERVTNPDYRQATEVVARLNLPRENVMATYQLGREMQSRAEALRADASLALADRAAAMAALAAEADERLGVILTRDGVSVFRNTGGSWLRRIESMGGAR